MCGIDIPPIIRYDTDWCWICWRRIWEAEYDRYYIGIKTSNGIILYEEVQSLRGVFAFDEDNNALIQKEKEKEKLKELHHGRN